MKRIWVKTNEDLDDDLFTGTVDEISERLKEFEDNLIAEGCREITLKWYSDYDYQAVRACYLRPETDEELERRKMRIKKRIAKLEKAEEERESLLESLRKELEE